MAKLESLDVPAFDDSISIHRWAYQVLRRNITGMALKPGQRISESDVAETLGISRTPAREAFIRLAEDGLLDIRPQRGTFISLIDVDEAWEARFVRLAVETVVMREACVALSEKDFEALESNIAFQERCEREGRLDRLLQADNEFHRIIYEACGKARSWSYLKNLDPNYERLRILSYSQVAEQTVHEHRSLVAVLREKRIGEVEAAIYRHLTWDVIAKVIKEYPQSYFCIHCSDRAGAEKPEQGKKRSEHTVA